MDGFVWSLGVPSTLVVGGREGPDELVFAAAEPGVQCTPGSLSRYQPYRFSALAFHPHFRA